MEQLDTELALRVYRVLGDAALVLSLKQVRTSYNCGEQRPEPVIEKDGLTCDGERRRGLGTSRETRLRVAVLSLLLCGYSESCALFFSPLLAGFLLARCSLPFSWFFLALWLPRIVHIATRANGKTGQEREN